MSGPIESLLKRFLELQSEKWHLVYKVYHKETNFLKLPYDYARLRQTIQAEIRVSRALENSIGNFLARHKGEGLESLLLPLVKLCSSISTLFGKELSVMGHSFPLSQSKIVLEGEAMQEMFGREARLSRKLESIISRNSIKLLGYKGFSSKKKEIERAKKIARLAKSALLKAVMAHDIKEAAKANRKLMKLLEMLRETEMYSYLKHDIDFIISGLKEMRKNPRKHKIKFMIIGTYFSTPFSFETVTSILFLKSAARYAVSKGKKLRNKLRGRRHLRIMQ